MSFSLSRNLLPIAIGTTAAVGAFSYYQYRQSALSNEAAKAALTGDWVDLKLKSFTDLTHDTRKFVFELPSKDQVSGLEVASCVITKYLQDNGKNVIRPYTPTSPPDKKGEMEFIIKKYEGGKMSTHIFGLKPNDTLSIKGPILKFKWQPNLVKNVVLLGGGTGITPLYQLITAITSNPDDKTKITLVYGNKTPEDVILHDELDKLAQQHPDQLQIHYFVDTEVATWPGYTGFITKDFLRMHIPSPSEDVKLFVCGPPPFYDALSGNKVSPSDQGELSGALKELGYSKDQVFKF